MFLVSDDEHFEHRNARSIDEDEVKYVTDTISTVKLKCRMLFCAPMLDDRFDCVCTHFRNEVHNNSTNMHDSSTLATLRD